MASPSTPSLRRATISDVAEACGVSITTVSKVMNRPAEGLDVSPAAQARVRAAARRLQYRPSWRAKVFAQQRTGVIGVLSHRPVPAVLRGVWGVAAETLVDVFAEHNRDVQFLSCGPQRPDRWKAMLADGRFEGVVVLDHLNDAMADVLQAAELPAVLLNAAPNGRYPAFIPDDRKGGRLAAGLLVARGHRNVLFAGDEHNLSLHFSFAERLAGVTEVLLEAGAPAPAVLQAPPPETVATLRTMAPRPTAIIAYHAMTAIKLHQALWRQGIGVPRDMGLVTFDDLEICRVATPPLTVVDVPMGVMATRAVVRLLEECDRLASGAASLADTEVFGETLVERESVGAVPPASGA